MRSDVLTQCNISVVVKRRGNLEACLHAKVIMCSSAFLD